MRNRCIIAHLTSLAPPLVPGAAGAQLVDAPEFPDKPVLIQIVPEIETFFLILPHLPPLLVPDAAGARLDDDAHEFPEKTEFPDASEAWGASVTLSELDCSGNVPVFACTALCAPVPVAVLVLGSIFAAHDLEGPLHCLRILCCT